jgi:hypothetical protein
VAASMPFSAITDGRPRSAPAGFAASAGRF